MTPHTRERERQAERCSDLKIERECVCESERECARAREREMEREREREREKEGGKQRGIRSTVSVGAVSKEGPSHSSALLQPDPTTCISRSLDPSEAEMLGMDGSRKH